MKIVKNITRNMVGLHGDQNEVVLNKDKQIELVRSLPSDGYYLDTLICYSKKDIFPIKTPVYMWVHHSWVE